MSESVEFSDIEELQRLKLLERDLEYFNEDVLMQRVQGKTYRNIMNKIMNGAGGMDAGSVQNSSVDGAQFCKNAAVLLEYDISSNTLDEVLVQMSVMLGVSVEEPLSNRAFFSGVISLLKSKTKNGIECMDKLCQSGVFKDFNKGKAAPEILVFNGKAQPIFEYSESIYEEVFIETPLDTDCDGKRDLILAYIRRPKETEAGMKVPAIYVANPYMMGCNDDIYEAHEVDGDMEIFDQTDVHYDDIRFRQIMPILPEPRNVKGQTKASKARAHDFICLPDWYNYFLVRGYALVFSGGIGTLRSEGVRTCGSKEETISTISVIDWLNGRLPAFSNKVDCLEVKADWSTGRVGMTGKSYLGTLAIAAATTGVEGLRTIVPEAAISSWYEYYRCNGLTLPAIGWQGDDADLLAEHCFSRLTDPNENEDVKKMFYRNIEKMRVDQDRRSGSYNSFWDERNYLNEVGNIKSSVFIVHGLNDLNVKSKQFDMLWEALNEHSIPCKMILHQGAHINIHNLEGIEYSNIMNRWFTHWLYDVENGAMDKIPNVIIQNNLDVKKWDVSGLWPFEGVKRNTYYVEGGELGRSPSKMKCEERIIDDIALTGYCRLKRNESDWLNALVSDPESRKVFRLVSSTGALPEDTRISGTIKVSVKAKFSERTGILSAMLVDYGRAQRVSEEMEIISRDLFDYDESLCKESLVNFKFSDEYSDFAVITRGWTSAQNRRNNYNKDEVIPGKMYEFNFDMQPIDYTMKKGHRLGFIVYSTDVQATQRQFRITEVAVETSSIKIDIPLCSMNEFT